LLADEGEGEEGAGGEVYGGQGEVMVVVKGIRGGEVRGKIGIARKVEDVFEYLYRKRQGHSDGRNRGAHVLPDKRNVTPDAG
jgi:hypothetical protein